MLRRKEVPLLREHLFIEGFNLSPDGYPQMGTCVQQRTSVALLEPARRGLIAYRNFGLPPMISAAASALLPVGG